MNMKKIVAAAAGIAVSCTLLVGTSFAASGWARCKAIKAGPWGSLTRIQVTGCSKPDPSAGKGGWMTMSPSSNTDQMLACTLTAMSLENYIAVYYDKTVKDSDGYVVTEAIMTTTRPL